VKLAMMDPAQRHRELIRYAATERPWLRETDVVSLAGFSAAHGARLASNEPNVIFVATAAGFHGYPVGSLRPDS
jgi:hypothetical protein